MIFMNTEISSPRSSDKLQSGSRTIKRLRGNSACRVSPRKFLVGRTHKGVVWLAEHAGELFGLRNTQAPAEVPFAKRAEAV